MGILYQLRPGQESLPITEVGLKMMDEDRGANTGDFKIKYDVHDAFIL